MPQDIVHLEAPPLIPLPPRWVEDLFGGGLGFDQPHDGNIEIRTNGPLAHAKTSIRHAADLDAQTLRSQVAAGYLALIRALKSVDRHPVRFWNFVPGIGEMMSPDFDRYMAFNAGRYDAFTERYGPANVLKGTWPLVATASAVGVTGTDLSMHCLAMDQPGVPIENPRQIPAWRYSARYGPLPPCFSRATIVRLCGTPRLLIGGTASVVGEDSMHPGNFDAQLEETLLNIEALVGAATDHADGSAPLQRLIDLRVYLTESSQAEPVRRILMRRCPRLCRLDLAIARICRRDLLVEIEGVAAL